MKVLVIGGGTSSERDISLRSSRAIYTAAKKAGHIVEFYDWNGTEGWIKEHATRFDVVLPILHGLGGEDGEIQRLLEKLEVKYLGSDSTASKVCFDKDKALDILSRNNVLTPTGYLVTFEQYQDDPLASNAHVLKPYNGGSSIDTFICADAASRDLNAIRAAFGRHERLLLEEFIQGVEITVPMLDGANLPIIEIVPPEGELFDRENKYNGRTAELIPPKNLSKELQASAKEIAAASHKVLGCRHLSRTDIIVANDKLYVLEVNTMPGMTDQSLFPKAAAHAGMEFPQFADYLIGLVVKA